MGLFDERLAARKRQHELDRLLTAVENRPDDARIRLKLGDLFRQMDRIDEAIDQYREACLLWTRRGFSRQARAARALILRLRPDDGFARRLELFPTDLDLARTQQPLPREEVPLSEDDETLPAEKAPEKAPAVKNLVSLQELERGKRDADDVWDDDVDLPEPEPPAAKKPEPPKKVEAPKPAVAAPPPAPAEVEVTVVEPPPPTSTESMRARPRERRVDPRVEAGGDVRLVAGNWVVPATLEDVSYSGLFVGANAAIPPRTPVDLALKLPGSEWIGLARAVVVRISKGGKRRGPGLGLALMWSDAPMERWIVEHVHSIYGDRAPRPIGDPTAKSDKEELRRAHPRREVKLPVALRTPDFEVSGWARDLSLGGVLVEAPRVFGAGTRVETLLWLPGVPQPLSIRSVIARETQASAARPRGSIGVRFIRVEDAQAAMIADEIASEVE